MPLYVYVIVSERTGRRYVGQTGNLPRRVAEHNSPTHKANKFTSKHPGPWQLVYHEILKTRSDAVRRERALKSGQGRQWLDRKLGRASPPEAD